jgi:antitoxin (DNA-binding transcriptional repressor) of toxin-antitoxin stability system
MKTIGAKELRVHLDQVLDRVLKGEDIIVSHRFKAPVRLSAVETSSDIQKRQALAGLRAFEAAPKKSLSFDSKKSVKELYHESITRKHVK